MAGTSREAPETPARQNSSSSPRKSRLKSLLESKHEFPSENPSTSVLHPGRFCLLCPKANRNDISALFGSLSSSLTLRGSFGGRGGNRFGGQSAGLQARIDGLVSDAKDEASRLREEHVGIQDKSLSSRTSSPTSALTTGSGLTALTVNNWNPAPHTWHLGHGSAAVVNFGLFEVTAGINRVQPSVFFDGSDEPCLCVFQGYLSNLEELMERYGMDQNFIDANKPRKTPGEKAAALLYTMVWSDDRNGEDPLVVLSELQGQYAFVMYNGDRKQVFAARDSSGKERLYFELDDENGVTVSNAKELRVRSVDGMGWVVFEELQPGHYLCGRPVKVNQFALTREEMKEREELLDGGFGGLEL